MNAEQSIARAKSIADVAFEEGRRLADDPNILAVGHGAKFRAGRPDVTEAVTFFVREKLALDAIAERGSWPVPSTIDGFPTDVVELGPLAAAVADRAPPAGNRGRRIDDPLVGGGASMSLAPAPSGPGGYGTLGAQCFDAATKAPLVLSNAHVWGVTNTEVAQPVTATTILGAAVAPASVGTPPLLVQTRVPTALAAATAFANAVGQAYLITGGDSNPLPTGQAATPVAADSRTNGETVTVSAPTAGVAPAGRRLSPTVGWTYRRFSTAAVADASSNTARTVSKLLAARRLFSNAASYTSGQPVNLYAEIVPAAGGAPVVGTAHIALALLYPIATGDKVIPRILRPAARQAVTTVTTSFQGFPAPARVGPALLPVAVGAFGVDSDLPGTFQTATGLPPNTLALRLPAGTVRVFVPPSTQVEIDIDLRGSAGPMSGSAFNSAGDSVATVTSAPGTGGRTIVSAAASEIVEVRLSGVSAALLFGVTSRRASPETTAPLCYAGTINSSELLPKGKWGVSLFVQASDSGFPESANVVETAIGAAALITDCSFDVV